MNARAKGNARLYACAAAFALAAAAAVVSVRRPALGVNPHASAPFRTGPIDTLEVTARGAHTTLRRHADAVWVTAPVTYVADPGAATAAFDAIEKLEANAVVTTRPQRYEELQVDPAHGISVRALLGDGVKLDLVVGKKLDEGTLVRLHQTGGVDPVWQVNGDLRVLFDKITAEWRDRSVITFTPADAREIQVDTRDGERIVVRAEDPTPQPGSPPPIGPRKWKLVSSTRDIPVLDALAPNELVSAMSSLKASDFADGLSLAAAGLEPPALAVTVTLKTGEKDVALIGGAAAADESYVKTSEGPQIYRVKSFNVERLAQRPVQFRNKLLCPLSDADIDEIAVKNGADSFTVVRTPGTRDWRATAPRGLRVDPTKVEPLASAFRAWRAPLIAEDRRPADVTGPGAVVITGGGMKGRCAVTAVTNPSARHGDRDAFLAVAPPAADVFILPRWTIERVALKLADLRAR